MKESSNKGASPKKLSSSHDHQISILRSLSQKGFCASTPKQFQINEIAQLSGLGDEKEVQRYLFILEGQKLVAPCPEGDFTSKVWHITKTGAKALKTIKSSMAV